MKDNLRIATWNVHAAVGLDHRYRPERIANVIAALDADVIALQEVPLGKAMCALLERDLGYRLVAAPTMHHRDEPFGNALLARLPLTRSTLVDLCIAQCEPRVAIDATVRRPSGHSVRIIATHLGLRRRERHAQCHTLAQHLDRNPVPVIVLGDFNEWRTRSTRLDTLRRHLDAAPTRATFPALLPLLPLDRIYASATLQLDHVRAHYADGARFASDHLPLVAELREADSEILPD